MWTKHKIFFKLQDGDIYNNPCDLYGKKNVINIFQSYIIT
jgi:hypothetical protein